MYKFQSLFLHKKIQTRIAPTPSGFLHIGNGLSFLYTWLLVRKIGGKLQLRIDDIDNVRTRKEYVQDIFDSLAWVGLDWDLGPQDLQSFEKQYSQQHRISLYNQSLNRLKAKGHLYACTCSRSQIKKRSGNGLYPNTCRPLELDLDALKTAWRLKAPALPLTINDYLLSSPQISLATAIGDFVIRKKDKKPAYQLVSLVEDIEIGTNLIVRGEDLLTSTAAQCHIASLLGEEQFGQIAFIHHPLLLDDDGQKLSKSAGAPALKSIRAQGGTIYQQCADWLGIPQTTNSLQALLEAFDPERHFP